MRELIIRLKEKLMLPDYSMRSFDAMAEELASKTKQTFDARYLKYVVYEGKSKSKIRISKLDVIARYLGYKDYTAFFNSLSVDPVLQSVVGDYYSYVRMNHDNGNLLRSPVKITWSDGHISYHQKGGRLEFSGKLQQHEGCLFVLMESAEGKSFYHVYRIGKRRSPEVLQGVFSGVSTDFKPIGGRAVLIRSKEPFEELKTGVLDIKKMSRSKRKEDLALAKYFQNRNENNLSIKRYATFDLLDLIDR